MYTIVLHNLTAMKTHVAKYTRAFPLLCVTHDYNYNEAYEYRYTEYRIQT